MNSSSKPSAPTDLATQWSSALRLHSIFVELAREFAIEAPPGAAFETSGQAPSPETVAQAQQWLQQMDDRIQPHQLRQFLQTTSAVDRDTLLDLIRHLIAKPDRASASRDKLDFLLVQYFSQIAPTGLEDSRADIAYVAEALEGALGKVDLKIPLWLGGLDRVLDSAGRCRSLAELLQCGVLEQGRKVKIQAEELFYLPVALIAFTRYGYLMRRVFFRLMLSDLNCILEGLAELDQQGVGTIDCRRAQFSQQEPILRLRMICQSWKVMFQAEYASGQPLRMLVDLRASVDAALGKGNPAESGEPALPPTQGAGVNSSLAPSPGRAAAAAAGSPASGKLQRGLAHQNDPPEFEISSAAPEWKPEED